jgi:hypothetical protein
LVVTPWEWITTTTSGETVFTTLGLGALAVLFATNRILTIGQHRSRVLDLVEHHTRELAEKDARIADAHTSRDGWRDVALKERELREAAMSGAVTAATSAIVDVKHVLESLDEALDGREKVTR